MLQPFQDDEKLTAIEWKRWLVSSERSFYFLPDLHWPCCGLCENSPPPLNAFSFSAKDQKDDLTHHADIMTYALENDKPPAEHTNHNSTHISQDQIWLARSTFFQRYPSVTKNSLIPVPTPFSNMLDVDTGSHRGGNIWLRYVPILATILGHQIICTATYILVICISRLQSWLQQPDV